MRPVSEMDKLPPAGVKLDDTPVPDNVAEAVAKMRGQGKKVTLKMSQADYNRLMCLPHEKRMAFAEMVVRDKERKAVALAARTNLRRNRRTKAKAMTRAQRRNRK